ncbi:MAG: ATP-dependent 6-phosphofructokinase [Firmicutes bacterium]|nr:ATP-dependent 6-phosphofructokinase [Bacillota bacterium]
MKTIGILTGGGDAPGLNAVIRAAVKTAIITYKYQVVGIQDGFDGLIKPGKMKPLTIESVHGILPKGGTILGTTNRGNPFEYKVSQAGEVVTKDYSSIVAHNVREAGIDCLIIVGGDGTLGIAQRFHEMGLPVVGIPKTIDNDLSATEFTFGFDTAVDAATWAVDRLHSTAESHHRVMLIEVMGRNAGWISLYSGVAGGADVILIPEIPYNMDSIVAKIQRRSEGGSKFSLIVVAEGAMPMGGGESYVNEEIDKLAPKRLGGAAETLANRISKLTSFEVRTTVLGHLQRGGSPSAYDRILGTKFGAAAVRLVSQDKYGYMVALRDNKVYDIEIAKAVGAMKTVSLDDDLLVSAKEMGICFGE